MGLDVNLPENLETMCKEVDNLLRDEEKVNINQELKRTFSSKLGFLQEGNFSNMVKALFNIGAIDENDTSVLSCIAEKSTNNQQIKTAIDKCKLPVERQIIGREEDVKNVSKLLENRKMVIPGVNLFGESGVGKTRLAQEIAKTFEEFKMISIDLRGIVEMKTVIFLILDAFQLQAWDYNQDRINVHLNKDLKYNTFVIIDNVEQLLSQDDESPRTEFIALLKNIIGSNACKTGKLKLLLTSREEIREPLLKRQFFSEYKVSPFTKEVSKYFISRRGKQRYDVSDESQDEALSKISELSRDIPYLLQGAAQMIREGFCTPVEVLHKIESQIEKRVPEKYACIGALFDSISSDHLKQLAVKISLLQQRFSESTAMKIARTASEIDAVINLEVLASHKILQKEKDERGKVKYDTHALFKEFVMECLCEKHPFFKDAYEKGEQQFFSHFSGKFTKLSELMETDFVETFKKLERNRANFELTFDISKYRSEAFEILLHSDEHNKVALIGILFEVLKDWKERQKLYDEWSTLAEEAGKWLTSANLRCWQALQGPDMEGTKDVLRIAEESLKKVRQKANTDQLKAGWSLFRHCRGRIGWLQAFKMSAKKESNERCRLLNAGIKDLKEALKMREGFMAKHTLNARTNNLIGNCYMGLDEPEKAEEFYKIALDMKVEIVGSDKHWEIPTFYNQMSQVHYRHGMKLEKGCLGVFRLGKAKEEYKKAVEWMEKALNLQEELGVADTEHTATFQRNLANALIGLGEYDEALENANKCYENRMKRLGEHPETVRILYLTGVIHEWRNDIKAACESFEKALKMEESLTVHNNSDIREKIGDRLKEMYSRLEIKDKGNVMDRINAIEKEVKKVPKIYFNKIKFSVDSHGGTYNIPSHGLFLDFPPGAVNTTIEMTSQILNTTSLPSPAGDMEAVVSFIVELEPCDVVLQKPVVVEVMHSGCVGHEFYENRLMAYNRSTKNWEEVPGQQCLYVPPNCLETEYIKVKLSKLTTLAVISRLITDTFEVDPVTGCHAKSSVCQDITLDFPEGAVDKRIKGSMKVLSCLNKPPTDFKVHPSPVVVVNGFEDVTFNQPVTLTVPHPGPSIYPTGKVYLYLKKKGGRWNEMTENIRYIETKSTIKLQIHHFSVVWIFVGEVATDVHVLEKELTGIPQEVSFVGFSIEQESKDVSTNVIKCTLCCMASHLVENFVQNMKDKLGHDFKLLTQVTAKGMLPKETVCINIEGGNFESREEVEIQFSDGNKIFSKDLIISKKEGLEETPFFFIKFVKKNSDEIFLAQTTIDLCQFKNVKMSRSSIGSSTTDSTNIEDLENVYTMSSNPRGILIIIENERFTNCKMPKLEDRDGSDKDVEKLSNVFCQYLDFEMIYLRNQKRLEILQNLRKELKEGRTLYDCCAVCVMSHGDDKGFYDSEGRLVKVSQVQSIVKDEFIGKPKLIFVQACRQKDERFYCVLSKGWFHVWISRSVLCWYFQINPLGFGSVAAVVAIFVFAFAGSQVKKLLKTTNNPNIIPNSEEKNYQKQLTDGNGSDAISIAREYDILTAYSCRQDSISLRYSSQGTLFIQNLAETFGKEAHRTDVLKMLDIVKENVTEQSSQPPFNHKQVCEIIERLTKKLYLNPNPR